MRRLLLTAILGLAVGVGCGGSGDGGSSGSAKHVSTSAPTATSKRRYIAQADAACEEFNKRVKRLPGSQNGQDIARVYRQVADEAQAFIATFKAISKPRRDVPILTRYEANLTDSIKVTKQVADAVERNDQRKVRDLYRSAKTLQRENRGIADRYGFHVCGGSVRR